MKKWLSVLLSMMLLFTAVPVWAENAEETVEATETAEAADEVSETIETVEEVSETIEAADEVSVNAKEEETAAEEDDEAAETVLNAGDSWTITFAEALKNWQKNVNPEVHDYVSTVASMDTAIGKAVLRAGNGITEVEVDKAETDENKEVSYKKAALFQYNGEDLTVEIGEKTWLIKAQDIAKYYAITKDFSDETLEAERQEVKKLTLAFIMEVLQPAISVNTENNAIHILVDVNQDQILERMPAFLESLSSDEEQINTLLLKYAFGLEFNGEQVPQTLAEIREFWQKKTEKPEDVPSFELKADAALIKPQADQPLQLGVVGHLIYRSDDVEFDAEYLPTNDGGFILNSFAEGTHRGETFNDSLVVNCRPDSFAANLNICEKVYTLTAARSIQNDNVVSLVVDLYADELPDGLELYGEYNRQLRDLFVGLYRGGANGDALATLEATLQDSGAAGAFTVQGQRFDFTASRNNLYYRLRVSPASGNTIANAEVDVWVFPMGEKNYRYRADIESTAAHVLISGSCSPDQLKLSVAPFGGEKIIDMTLSQTLTDEGRQIVADLMMNSGIQCLKLDVDLKLNAKEQPVFLDGVLKIMDAVEGNVRSIYQVSYVPGLATYTDGTDYYELVREEDTETRLLYSLIRNRTKELGTLLCELGENENLSVELVWDNQVIYRNEIRVQDPEPSEVKEAEEKTEVLGIFEGTTNEEGIITGVIAAMPSEEEKTEDEPLKIEPIDTTDATVIDVNAVVKAGPELDELAYQLFLLILP